MSYFYKSSCWSGGDDDRSTSWSMKMLRVEVVSLRISCCIHSSLGWKLMGWGFCVKQANFHFRHELACDDSNFPTDWILGDTICTDKVFRHWKDEKVFFIRNQSDISKWLGLPVNPQMFRQRRWIRKRLFTRPTTIRPFTFVKRKSQLDIFTNRRMKEPHQNACACVL